MFSSFRNTLIYLGAGLGAAVLGAVIALLIVGANPFKTEKRLRQSPLPSQKTSQKSLPSPSSSQVLPLTRFTDQQYKFSFLYPSNLKVVKVDNPKEKLLQFARKNYKSLPVRPSISPLLTPLPSPSLETTLPIIKQYSVVNPATPETGLIDVSLVKGNYQPQAQQAQEMAKAYQAMPDTKDAQVVSYSELNLPSNRKATVFNLPDGSGRVYTVAYYPFDNTHYLMVEVQPEAQLDNSQTLNNILLSVKIF